MTLAALPADVPKNHQTFVEKRRDSAHKRHLDSMKALNETRKLVGESPFPVPLPEPKAYSAG
jgi:hypothetical protein